MSDLFDACLAERRRAKELAYGYQPITHSIYAKKSEIVDTLAAHGFTVRDDLIEDGFVQIFGVRVLLEPDE